MLWRQEMITLGEVVAFMGLFGTLRFTTFISIFSFNLVQLGMAGAERILTMIKAETELDQNLGGRSQTIKGEVVFENVGFSYNGKAVLNNISFTALSGETVAIVGMTGSGKTSLTRLINRIFDAATGRVLVDGQDVRAWDLESLRSQISTIEQDIFLFSRTLSENIAFGQAEAAPDNVEKAAKEAQAHEFISAFPEGYETVIGESGRHTLGRTAAAHRHCPGISHRSQDSDPRRFDKRHRQRHRGSDPAGHASDFQRADHFYHHPPTEPDSLGRPHPGAAQGGAWRSGHT